MDMNVLMSALIKDSLTRRLISKSQNQLWFPEAAYKLLLGFRKAITKRTGSEVKDVDALIKGLFTHIRIFPGNEMGENSAKARRAMAGIDLEDAIFVACALSLPDSAVWSNDKHLKMQKLVMVYTTEELVKEYGSR